VDLSKQWVSQKAITLDGFKQTRFDLIISSVPQHFVPFSRLQECYQPHAPHVFHMGNVSWQLPEGVQNLMTHVQPPEAEAQDINVVVYDQEFDLQIFCPAPNPITPSTEEVLIRSYVHFPSSEALWKSLGLTPEGGWKFEFIGRTLGSLNETIIESAALARSMQEAHFIWHVKPGGEGYGHILMNVLAIGRPVIINANDFKGTRGGRLLEDGVTCINTDDRSAEEICGMLYDATEPSRYQEYCTAVTERFRNTVDFDADAQRVQQFLKELR